MFAFIKTVLSCPGDKVLPCYYTFISQSHSISTFTYKI